MPVIYLDVLIILNWVIDFVLLHATAFILHLPYRTWRLVAAGAVGGAGSCIVLLPLSAWPGLLCKLLLALLITLTAFGWNGYRPWLEHTAVFFIVSSVFAGIACAVWFFAAPRGMRMVQGVLYYDISVPWLIALTAGAYLLLRLADRLLCPRIPAGQIYPMEIGTEKGTVCLQALYDTGASPADVFSGRPAVVAERGALAAVLPADFPLDVQALPARGVRLIPVRTLSGPALLPAFKARRLRIGDTALPGVYVAVTPTLGGQGYQALFGREVGHQIKEKKLHEKPGQA
ncbi:MAG: sigma-E processing peptidase SpoIIGA [Clostridia bacterium]|nr:sigma-E processing peptidase SpoIIGA [Clostridia bacterium]